jgi:hypothetical protein
MSFLRIEDQYLQSCRILAPRTVTYRFFRVDSRRGKRRTTNISSTSTALTLLFSIIQRAISRIGTITNVGGQGCTNVLYGYGKKTFWIVAGENQITEFQVPKKAIKTLSTPGLAPSSCAINLKGDLAVGILGGYPSGGGDVVIFKGAGGAGRVVSNTPLIAEYFDGYDDKGNLFADGHDSNLSFALVELPKDGNRFEQISTSDSVKLPGSVPWDGKYLTVLDQSTLIIHRYNVTGRRAVLKGTVSLTGVECSQTWIATGIIYCADGLNDDGAVF